MRYAPIAQLDRVTDYESVGRGFESLSAYQLTTQNQAVPGGFSLFYELFPGTFFGGADFVADLLQIARVFPFMTWMGQRVPFGVSSPNGIMDPMALYGFFAVEIRFYVWYTQFVN